MVGSMTMARDGEKRRSGTRVAIRRRNVARANDDDAPLKGFVIVTLALNVPAPVAAARLSQLGATVIKVEPPGGDALHKKYCPRWYRELVRKQRVLQLDLKEPKDRARLDDFLARSHLLLTSIRLSSLRRISLGWKQLHSKFPALSHVALLGHPAPRREIAGHDLTYLARLGLLEPPSMPRTLWADLVGAERVVQQALIVLLTRSPGKPGVFREVTIEEAITTFAAPLRYGLTGPGGDLGGGLAQYNLYRASDAWVCVAALEPHFQARLKKELGLATLGQKNLGSALLARTAMEWERWAIKRDLPICAVRRFDDG
jgi:alpha-methylacyl-CoA racemase